MIAPRSFLRHSRHAAVLCLLIGAVCCWVGVVSFVLSRNLFDPIIFGRRAADSLSDPGVAAYTADLITNGIVHRKPDLIAFRRAGLARLSEDCLVLGERLRRRFVGLACLLDRAIDAFFAFLEEPHHRIEEERLEDEEEDDEEDDLNDERRVEIDVHAAFGEG